VGYALGLASGSAGAAGSGGVGACAGVVASALRRAFTPPLAEVPPAMASLRRAFRRSLRRLRRRRSSSSLSRTECLLPKVVSVVKRQQGAKDKRLPPYCQRFRYDGLDPPPGVARFPGAPGLPNLQRSRLTNWGRRRTLPILIALEFLPREGLERLSGALAVDVFDAGDGAGAVRDELEVPIRLARHGVGIDAPQVAPGL
jgi:hypothetical protein